MRIKKILILAFTSLALIATFAFGISVFAEEQPVNPDDTQETQQYPCTVVENVGNGGAVSFTVTEGNVGDVVTALVKPDFLYSVTSVKINGQDVKITKDGKYEFALVEGENLFQVEFAVNNEKIQEIVNLVEQTKENGIASLFTVSNLLTFVTWLITALLSSGFFITLIRNKKLRSATIADVQNAVTSSVNAEVAKAINEFLEKTFNVVLNTITDKVDGTNECMKVVCRCLVLAQNDTPENKLAIINELTNLNVDDEELTNKIRGIVKEEQAKQQEKIAARDKAIEDLKQSNENLSAKEDLDNYGQL